VAEALQSSSGIFSLLIKVHIYITIQLRSLVMTANLRSGTLPMNGR
jgi:hypothetical protein